MKNVKLVMVVVPSLEHLLQFAEHVVDLVMLPCNKVFLPYSAPVQSAQVMERKLNPRVQLVMDRELLEKKKRYL